MISYYKIGRFGRLGNQMFQFASTLGIARKLGYECAFPIENINEPVIEHFKDGISRECYFDLPKGFNISNKLLLTRSQIIDNIRTVVSERQFHYDEKFLSILDGSEITGYLQSEKYFIHIKDEILNNFSFKEEILIKAKQIIPKTDRKKVSIHFRRGDYVNMSYFHPPLPFSYYQKALELFTDQEYDFLIFSDDIKWCQDNLGNQENIYYINNNQFIDMCIMSLCDNNIIANSSFSWWGAWLNQNPERKVIAPIEWFGPGYSHYNTNDLYSRDWIKI